MNKLLLSFLVFMSAIGFAAILNFAIPSHPLNAPAPTPTPVPKPLLVYTFDNLKKTNFKPSKITFGRKISETPNYVSQMFYFSVPARPGEVNTLKVSGLANIPKSAGAHPIIVMFRGYVPYEIYGEGVGSQPSAKVFAANGYITLAPDFLGYGESETGASGFENRFQTYTTALTLLNSLTNLNSGLEASYSGQITANTKNVGIWGHSNGGHIALTTLAISGVSYPTVLWAPVSKSFPYSILYYTDETDDQGKSLRLALSSFEEKYDTNLFSPERYYKWIKASIEINQGTGDQEVPVWWSDELVMNLKKLDVDVSYYTYPGADHNLLPNGWSQAVTNSLNFFNEKLQTFKN